MSKEEFEQEIVRFIPMMLNTDIRLAIHSLHEDTENHYKHFTDRCARCCAIDLCKKYGVTVN